MKIKIDQAADDARLLSGEMLNLLAESVQDYVILLLDSNGIVQTWNGAAEKITGFKAKDILGHSFTKFFAAEDVASGIPERELEDAAKQGRIEVESWRVRKDGSRFWANVVTTALRNSEGELVGYGKVARDLTAWKLLEEERERFFNLSLDMLCIANEDGYFKRVSQAFTNTLGWSVEELTTRPFMEFVHPEDRAATLREVDRQVMAGEQVLNFENRYMHQDGSWRILSWKSMPGPNGFMYATARDVSDQRATEAEIKKLNEGLRQRAIELEKARQEADRANGAKSEFLSRMSHELRTPLNAVIGYAQLLEMNSDDPKTLAGAKSILKGGRHLLGLINEILDLARIESGKLTLSLEPVPLNATISHTIDLIRPAAEEKGIAIEVSRLCEGIHVRADRQRLVQVLLNLLTNATKYNRPNGCIHVNCMEGDNELRRIEVRDTGVGIASEDLCRLFQPFERLGNHAVEGTGLGLALSQSLMELMGGTLTLVSTGPEGSTFAIELQKAAAPIAIATPSFAHSTMRSAQDEDDLRIVYIEDNLSNIQLLESVFAEMGGVELLPAMLGTLGITLVADHLPDIVLLDLHLPDTSGLEVLRELRNNPRTANIPVVVLSADATENQINRLLQAGAKAYLTKPIDLPSLFTELNDVRSLRGRAA